MSSLQRLYSDLVVELAGQPSVGGPIPIRVGLKQGCPCSPVLFSVYFDRVERAVRDYVADQGREFSSHVVRILSL